MWQTVLVIIIVAAAAAYAGRHLWRSVTKPESACGCGCGGDGASPGGCPAAGQPQHPEGLLPKACQGCSGTPGAKDAH